MAEHGGQMQGTDPTTIRLARSWRVMFVALSAIFGALAVAGFVAMASAGLWGFGLFLAAVAGGIALVWLRSARMRLVIGSGELLVANQLKTRTIRRDQLSEISVGRSSNPLGIARTVVLRLTGGDTVRIDAAARFSGDDAPLAELAERLTAWRVA